MKRLTAISLPVSAAAERDSEGFKTEDITWQDSIPATMRDATRREQVDASQEGYKIDQIYETRFYEGQSILRDDADGQIYDIQQAVFAAGGFVLDCTRRERGRGY